jgi:hypothetical protein
VSKASYWAVWFLPGHLIGSRVLRAELTDLLGTCTGVVLSGDWTEIVVWIVSLSDGFPLGSNFHELM